MVWISVVLVVATGMFFLRDNIAKFINNAATQITGEKSEEKELNEYGFFYGEKYVDESTGRSIIFYEDGSMTLYSDTGSELISIPSEYMNHKPEYGYVEFIDTLYKGSSDGNVITSRNFMNEPGVGETRYVLQK